jgi:superfamily II DNA helicase RecQ
MEAINILKKILNSDDETLKKEIENNAFKRYAQTSKPLQVDMVLNLIRGRNTFLLAATGFGKLRIPEMYLNMTTKNCTGRCIGVVVVLNPLDALGNDQVAEKIAAGYSAITRGEEGALPKECHSLTFFCNSGGYLPYIFL